MASSTDLLSSEPPASESILGHENKNKQHMSPNPDCGSIIKKPFEEEPAIDDSVMYRETDHLSTLCDNLKAFRESNMMCDVEIQLGETKVLAHKCVLAASSKQMKTILTGDDPDNILSSVNFPTDTPNVFMNILDYLYTGCLSVCMSNIQNLITLSEKLEIEGVVPLCCKHLEESVTIENWSKVFKLALGLKLDSVVKAIESYAVDYFSFMSSSNNFTDIEFEHFRSIVCSCNIEDDADLEMYKIKEILKWLNHKEERVKHIEDLLQLANLDCVENVLALETFIQELALSTVVLENPMYADFLSKLESEKHRPHRPVQEIDNSAENDPTVIELTVLPSQAGVKSEAHASDIEDTHNEDLPDSDATYEGYEGTEMHEQHVNSKPKRVIPNVNIRYTEIENDDLYEPKNKRKSFKPKRLQLKRLKLRKGPTGRPRGRPPKPKIIIERRSERKPKMKTSCTQVLAENIEEEFQEIERETKAREEQEAADNAVGESNIEDMLALGTEDTIKVEPEAPEDFLKKTKTRIGEELAKGEESVFVDDDPDSPDRIQKPRKRKIKRSTAGKIGKSYFRNDMSDNDLFDDDSSEKEHKRKRKHGVVKKTQMKKSAILSDDNAYRESRDVSFADRKTRGPSISSDRKSSNVMEGQLSPKIINTHENNEYQSDTFKTIVNMPKSSLQHEISSDRKHKVSESYNTDDISDSLDQPQSDIESSGEEFTPYELIGKSPVNKPKINQKRKIKKRKPSANASLVKIGDKFVCAVEGCDFTSKFKGSLMRHKQTVHEKTHIRCKLCGSILMPDDLDAHNRKHHSEAITCDFCSKAVKSMPELRTHILQYHTDPAHYKYVCSHCGKRFHHKTNFEGHMDSHNDVKSWHCHLCQKGFSFRSSLLRHVKCCKGKKPAKKTYPCESCGLVFKLKDYLNQHMVGKHSGELNYPCICGRTFAWRGSLVNHKKTCKVVLTKHVQTDRKEGIVTQNNQVTENADQFNQDVKSKLESSTVEEEPLPPPSDQEIHYLSVTDPETVMKEMGVAIQAQPPEAPYAIATGQTPAPQMIPPIMQCIYTSTASTSVMAPLQEMPNVPTVHVPSLQQQQPELNQAASLQSLQTPFIQTTQSSALPAAQGVRAQMAVPWQTVYLQPLQPVNTSPFIPSTSQFVSSPVLQQPVNTVPTCQSMPYSQPLVTQTGVTKFENLG